MRILDAEAFLYVAARHKLNFPYAGVLERHYIIEFSVEKQTKMAHPNILNQEKTALVVVDLQEAFRSPINDFAQIVSRAALVIRGFQILGLPVIVTEQYPKGLGRI